MSEKFESLQGDGYPCVIAELDNKIIGFANASPYHTRTGYRWTIEDSVYVNPNFHGKGIGLALLNEIIKRSEKLGFRQMIAAIGDANNSASIGLHLKCGFEMTGTLKSVGYKNGHWLDVVIMQKALGEACTTHPYKTDHPDILF